MFFGDYWPLVGLVALIVLVFVICVLIGYVDRTFQAPVIVVQRMAALFPWPSVSSSAAPAADRSLGPTRVRWMGPEAYQEVIRGRGQQRKPNDVLLRIGGQVARVQLDATDGSRVSRDGLRSSIARVVGSSSRRLRDSSRARRPSTSTCAGDLVGRPKACCIAERSPVSTSLHSWM